MISILHFAIKYEMDSFDVQNAAYKYNMIDEETGKLRYEYDEIELYNAIYRYLIWINRKEERERDILIKRTKRRNEYINYLINHNPNLPESNDETKRPED